jgi:hypothetical protein
MSNFKGIWPLAFSLAMASGSSQADAPINTDPVTFFKAGSLADTLINAPASNGENKSRSVDEIQLSQWFNFFNCFNGVWRRC